MNITIPTDTGFNIHIYNLLKRFMKTRDGDKIFKIGAIPLAIQVYGQITIEIIDLNRMKPLVLYNITYISGFSPI